MEEGSAVGGGGELGDEERWSKRVLKWKDAALEEKHLWPGLHAKSSGHVEPWSKSITIPEWKQKFGNMALSFNSEVSVFQKLAVWHFEF